MHEDPTARAYGSVGSNNSIQRSRIQIASEPNYTVLDPLGGGVSVCVATARVLQEYLERDASGNVSSVISSPLLSTYPLPHRRQSTMKFASLFAFVSLISSAMAVYVTSADGTQIWAESTGDSSKPAVVFIPGFSCTSLAFDKQWGDSYMKTNLFMVRKTYPLLPPSIVRLVTMEFDHLTEFVILNLIGPI